MTPDQIREAYTLDLQAEQSLIENKHSTMKPRFDIYDIISLITTIIIITLIVLL